MHNSRSEREVMNEILVWVTAQKGGMFWRQNTGRGMLPDRGFMRPVQFGLPGTPDILGVWRGRGVGIEAKSALGRQSEEQRNWQLSWEAAGGLYILARSIEDVRAALL